MSNPSKLVLRYQIVPQGANKIQLPHPDFKKDLLGNIFCVLLLACRRAIPHTSSYQPRIFPKERQREEKEIERMEAEVFCY